MDEIADRTRIRPNRQRSQLSVKAPAASLEREAQRPDARDEVEPVQDLRRVEVGRHAQLQRRVVIVRHERTHGREDLCERAVVHRDETGPQQIGATGLADHVDPVGEGVHPDRIGMQLSVRPRIEREDPRVPVAHAR